MSNIQEIKKALVNLNAETQQLYDLYKNIVVDLNNLYRTAPQIYNAIQRTVELPNEDTSENISNFCKGFILELENLADEEVLEYKMQSSSDVLNDKMNPELPEATNDESNTGAFDFFNEDESADDFDFDLDEDTESEDTSEDLNSEDDNSEDDNSDDELDFDFD